MTIFLEILFLVFLGVFFVIKAGEGAGRGMDRARRSRHGETAHPPAGRGP